MGSKDRATVGFDRGYLGLCGWPKIKKLVNRKGRTSLPTVLTMSVGSLTRRRSGQSVRAASSRFGRCSLAMTSQGWLKIFCIQIIGLSANTSGFCRLFAPTADTYDSTRYKHSLIGSRKIRPRLRRKANGRYESLGQEKPCGSSASWKRGRG